MLGPLRRLIPSFVRRRYALKFGIALLVLGLSVGAMGLVATGALTDSVESSVLEDQESTARQEASALDEWVAEHERFLSSTSKAPVVQNGNDEEINDYLLSLRGEVPEEAEHVLYVDRTTGEVIADTGQDVGIENVNDANFPDGDRLEGDLLMGDVQRTEPYKLFGDSERADRPAISYYVATSEDRALVYTVNPSERLLYSSSSVVTVVDGEGRIVGDSSFLGYNTGEPVFLESYGDDAVLETAANGGTGATVIDRAPSETLQGAPYQFTPDSYVVGYATTDAGWTVLVHTSEADAFGFVNAVNQYGIGVTAVVVLLIGSVGAVLGRNTSKSIDRLKSKAAAMEDGDLDVDLETKRIDSIGRLYDGFDSMRVALREQIEDAEAAREEAERERERVERMNDHLEAKADEYSAVMQDAADGDLTVRMEPESENEALTEIGEEFNAMLADLEATVAGLNQFATDVATASEEVTASSEEVQRASREVSESVQEISDGADRQHQSLQSIDSEMNTLSTTTEEIAASSNDVADVAARTAETGRGGRETAEAAIDAFDDLEAEYEDVVAEFEQLRNQINQIESLTDTIAEIADQTNMLALNANIEASRSADGADAEGFTAVASEVKQLSADTKEAAAEIDERLDALQSQTEESADVVDRTSEEIERVNDLVTDVVASLDDIAEYAAETNDGVQEISSATEEQAAATQEVVAMVDEVASISEETTAEAQTVAAAAEEQTSSMQEVSASADRLSHQATRLSGALDRFETDVEGDGLEFELEGDAPEPVDEVTETSAPETTDAAIADAEPGTDEADDGDDADPLAFVEKTDEADLESDAAGTDGDEPNDATGETFEFEGPTSTSSSDADEEPERPDEDDETRNAANE
ncbi:methyl-accepting chemotaxis protein [Halopiger xanaduensis]|uniref:Methyl-accepting chemotaxis sensory transducer n=1 Tax=Halopiger xanaduensis (strain DSM 18323 / JCM 14033 / SH-6) TaxID=797210 RepID=F8D686_HALXS|nr:methyl-accepting chemotaxis protein [Halopiger xanaduensis]AEH35332.1 methyl-accepting chemotaxis sensory transducer [Halopiger xanaduensis SH-6]